MFYIKLYKLSLITEMWSDLFKISFLCDSCKSQQNSNDQIKDMVDGFAASKYCKIKYKYVSKNKIVPAPESGEI